MILCKALLRAYSLLVLVDDGWCAPSWAALTVSGNRWEQWEVAECSVVVEALGKS